MAYFFTMILPVTFDVSTDRQYSGTQIILGNVASPGCLDRPHLVYSVVILSSTYT